jgi:hypothetical protein
VRHRAVDVAPGLGDRGAIDRGHGRDGAKLALPVGARVAQRGRRRLQTGLCRVEPGLHPVEVALGEAAPSQVQGEQRTPTRDVVGQRGQPVAQGAVLAAPAQVGHGELDEVGGVLVVAAPDGVPDGIAELPVRGEPAAGRGVQRGDPVGIPRSQPSTQGVGEEVVVAVPPALVVERDDEQVLALKGLEHRLAVGPARQGVAETAGQRVEHGGLQQERPDLVRLAVQDLLDEVVQDEPMASGEGLDEPGDVSRAGVGPSRQRGQLQPGRPPFGARRERGYEWGIELDLHHLVEERLRFVGGEPQVGRPHLHELATRTQARQRERRVRASGHRDCDLRRQVVQQEGHRLVDGGAVDDVVVVERHHRGTGEHVEIIDQADQDAVGRAGLQRRERVDAGFGRDGLDRRREVGQEHPQVGVGRVKRQPGHPLLRTLSRQPLRQQRGLAEPGRRGDQDQSGRFASVRAQPIGEAGPRHQPATRPGRAQLGAQHRHRSACAVRRGPPHRRRV